MLSVAAGALIWMEYLKVARTIKAAPRAKAPVKVSPNALVEIKAMAPSVLAFGVTLNEDADTPLTASLNCTVKLTVVPPPDAAVKLVMVGAEGALGLISQTETRVLL